MYLQTIHTIELVEYLICSLLPLPFSLLTLFVIVYNIRMRYKLYQEIKRIPKELLFKEEPQNQLIINNFIIVILVLEFVHNFSGQNTFLYPLVYSVQ